MDRFSQILYDLGKELNIDLHVDQNRVCQINYRGTLHFQLEYLEPKEELLLAAFLCDVPPGKYRETLFHHCLVYNGIFPRVGTFGYSQKNNQLTYFTFIAAANLTGEKLSTHLEQFIQSALQWKDAVEGGKPLPTITTDRP